MPSLEDWQEQERKAQANLWQHLGNVEALVMTSSASPAEQDRILGALKDARWWSAEVHEGSYRALWELQGEFERLHEMREAWEDEHGTR